MGWPKGMPRKGHINKDGTKHAHWGELTAKPREAGKKTAKIKKVDPSLLDQPKRRGRPRKDGGEPDKKWNTKLTNKGLDPCPRCGFPEAYGGYCDECGWTAPMRYGRVA